MFRGDSQGLRPGPGSVCLVANDFDYVMRNGGIGTYHWLTAKLLAEQGWRVHVLFCGEVHDRQALAGLPGRLADLGVGFARLDDFDLPAHVDLSGGDESQNLDKGERVRYALEELHRRHHFDLAEFADWGALGFRCVQAKRAGLAFEDLRLAVKLHGSSQWMREGNLHWMGQPNDLERDYCERYAFEHADLQVSPCRSMLDYARRAGWRVRDDARVIPYPLPEPEFVPPGPEKDGPPEIVFFGRLETRKGLEIFVEAVRRLDPQVPVTFLGRETLLADATPALKYIQAELKGRPVKVLNRCNREQALGYLSACHRLAVMPSLLDNLPFTVIECAINGIPFLASRVGGIPEIVTDPEAQAWLLFEPNARDLFLTLKGFLHASPAERRLLRENARAALDVPATNRRVAEAYRDLLKEADHSPADPATARAEETPLVTVAVPYYNLGAFLPETLASLAAQTYPNLEVLVINDGSTDPDSIRVFEEQRRLYPRFRFLSQENSGIGATRNRGLGEARGELFIPMDADNVAFPFMVERFVRCIRRNPGLAAMTCFYVAFEEPGDLAADRFAYAYRPTGGPRVMSCFKNVYGDATAVFRTAVFRSVGGYETDRDTSWEDWEAFIKLVNAGHAVDVIPEPLFAYRHREAGFSRVTRAFQNHQRVLRQVIRTGPLPAVENAALWTVLVSLQKRYEELRNDNHALRLRFTALRYRFADLFYGVARRMPFVTRGMKGFLRSTRRAWGYVRTLV